MGSNLWRGVLNGSSGSAQGRYFFADIGFFRMRFGQFAGLLKTCPGFLGVGMAVKFAKQDVVEMIVFQPEYIRALVQFSPCRALWA